MIEQILTTISFVINLLFLPILGIFWYGLFKVKPKRKKVNETSPIDYEEEKMDKYTITQIAIYTMLIFWLTEETIKCIFQILKYIFL